MSERASVRAFWEEAPCGTRELASVEERARWAELEQVRYRREPFIRDFARFAEARGRRVLEVGCGAGTDLLQFARAGAEAFAVDLTSAGATMCARRLEAETLPVRISLADAERLPFADGTFDLAYSWGVIHHTPDTGRAAREILRVLKRGGRFCVMVYNRHSLVGLQVWARYGLLAGRPTARISELLSRHMESPGTKGYRRSEARALFDGATSCDVHTVVTPYDVRVGRRRFLPSAVRALVPDRFGWFHVVTGIR